MPPLDQLGRVLDALGITWRKLVAGMDALPCDEARESGLGSDGDLTPLRSSLHA